MTTRRSSARTAARPSRADACRVRRAAPCSRRSPAARPRPAANRVEDAPEAASVLAPEDPAASDAPRGAPVDDPSVDVPGPDPEPVRSRGVTRRPGAAATGRLRSDRGPATPMAPSSIRQTRARGVVADATRPPRAPPRRRPNGATSRPARRRHRLTRCPVPLPSASTAPAPPPAAPDPVSAAPTAGASGHALTAIGTAARDRSADADGRRMRPDRASGCSCRLVASRHRRATAVTGYFDTWGLAGPGAHPRLPLGAWPCWPSRSLPTGSRSGSGSGLAGLAARGVLPWAWSGRTSSARSGRGSASLVVAVGADRAHGRRRRVRVARPSRCGRAVRLTDSGRA